MVKKIKKYVKFIVCCTLIMSLVAPSYAALSASDGSAFVTNHTSVEKIQLLNAPRCVGRVHSIL